MTSIRHSICCAIILSIVTTASGEAPAESEFQLPQNPRAWINGAPISVEAMRGKAIVLYFFEEGCPRCREKWPGILAAVQQNQSNPVMLIAVNSGSEPAQVASYVRQNRISVPVIIDYDRSLETQAGVNKVSLQNIYQARIIDPDGELQRTNGGDIPAALATAAESASWNVDPTGMPPNIIPTWRQIEFGDYRSAAKSLMRFGRDRKPEVRSAAEKLQAYVDEKIQSIVTEAESATGASDDWKAYQLYSEVAQRFAGYQLPESVDTELEKLKQDESIQNEIAGMKRWQLALKLSQGGRANPAKIAAVMDKIIDKYPGTEAAGLAEAAKQ
ncbi:Thiol-disulfide oxidoreductase ResA [Rubripirellula obstinata]|uniref:Thiol-disulfide oxidoreductase ResA n=1 Tax=Rubripirellula obstinata TaxID=406547 RepID=A0A5B1CQ24_9BACT|nr:redoxin domain-containing protein [Rubripirellula obstinata]KAA1262492.1 Thiol-disulfide oxidoreductase ResA [Rubripirellula obstinata]